MGMMELTGFVIQRSGNTRWPRYTLNCMYDPLVVHEVRETCLPLLLAGIFLTLPLNLGFLFPGGTTCGGARASPKPTVGKAIKERRYCEPTNTLGKFLWRVSRGIEDRG